MPSKNSYSARDCVSGRSSKFPLSQFEQGATSSQDQAISPPGARQGTQPHASSSGAPSRPLSTAETREGQQISRAQSAIGSSAIVATQAQPLQTEGSGYMSTESDTDSGTTKQTQRKVALTGAQATGDSKGHSRQMITMAFLEEGGYFDVPIQVASARLGLGVTTLKRVCRAGNMQRWPFRKRNSLGRLIDRTKQVLDDGTGQDNMQKLAALQVLEKQRQVMRSCQSKDMDEQIQSYRQAILEIQHAQRRRDDSEASTSEDQSSQVSSPHANTVAQHTLPAHDRSLTDQIPAEQILAQLAQSANLARAGVQYQCNQMQ
ncbi:hypothetical protein ABBQ32_009041 [Trebouxia sp. C0010 RCD-2024]